MFTRSNLQVSRVRLAAGILMMILSATSCFITEVRAQQAPRVSIPDVLVRDQEGRKVRFYSDLIKDKVVVLNFFYTSCTYTCTMQGRTFSKLQSLLGDRMGKSVYLISVTTDPVKDNPEKLQAWAKRYQLKAGWTLVTGDESEINKILVQLTGGSAGAGMHFPVTFVVNDQKGTWISSTEIVAPEQLLKTVDYLMRDHTSKSLQLRLDLFSRAATLAGHDYATQNAHNHDCNQWSYKTHRVSVASLSYYLGGNAGPSPR